MYQKIKDNLTGKLLPSIRRLEDGAIIPMVEDNKDYREYLSWKKISGNTIQAAD